MNNTANRFQEDDELIANIRDTVEYLFKEVLGKNRPEEIKIIIGDREKDTIAMFKSEPSSESYCEILLNERVIEKWKKHYFSFHITFFHELMHAADVKMIKKLHLYDNRLEMSNKKFNIWQVKKLMRVLDRFRTEGIAELGTSLLCKRDLEPCDCKEDIDFWENEMKKDAKFNQNADVRKFSQLIDKVLNADVRLTKELKEETKKRAYQYGPAVILRVLRNLQLISKTDEERVCAFLRWNGTHRLEARKGIISLETQQEAYDMSIEDRAKVMNACLSINFPLFLEGLLLCREGNPMVSVSRVLQLCGDAQRCRSDDKINLFSELITQPQLTVKDFNKTMRVLAGRPMTEEALTRKMNEIRECPGWPNYYKLNDKLNCLYDYFLEHKAAGHKPQSLAAKHALHYFFKLKDLIVDYLPGFGYVDDLLVVDTALDILKEEENQ